MRLVYLGKYPRGTYSACNHFGLKDGAGNITKLRPIELRILLAVMGRPFLDFETAMEAAWPDCETMPETWLRTLSVHVCHLRKKLRGSGWKIETVWGVGWRLQKVEPCLTLLSA